MRRIVTALSAAALLFSMVSLASPANASSSDPARAGPESVMTNIATVSTSHDTSVSSGALILSAAGATNCAAVSSSFTEFFANSGAAVITGGELTYNVTPSKSLITGPPVATRTAFAQYATNTNVLTIGSMTSPPFTTLASYHFMNSAGATMTSTSNVAVSSTATIDTTTSAGYYQGARDPTTGLGLLRYGTTLAPTTTDSTAVSCNAQPTISGEPAIGTSYFAGGATLTATESVTPATTAGSPVLGLSAVTAYARDTATSPSEFAPVLIE